jgi:hypothetical protein
LQNEQYQNKMKQSDERLLALVKAAMDTVVAIGLLQLAPKKITPRVTGALGFITSLISCYQVVTSASAFVVHVFFKGWKRHAKLVNVSCALQQLPSRAPVAKIKV